MQLVVFHLNGQRYALPLAAVERLTGAVELTPLPGAPAIVAGVIDVAGCVVPVFCIRRRFLLPQREIVPADQLLIARTERRTVALVIDGAQGVIECEPSAVIDSERFRIVDDRKGTCRADGLRLTRVPRQPVIQ